MRIGCLQFAPQVGDVDNNLNRADAVLLKANPENLDILVLPEMAFSGMAFPFFCFIHRFTCLFYLRSFFCEILCFFRHDLAPCVCMCRKKEILIDSARIQFQVAAGNLAVS